VDVNGVPLRYKILIHNMRVKQVLYNTGSSIESVQFREFRIQAMQSFGAGIEESKDGSTSTEYVNVAHLSRKKFGAVTHVPLAMLSTPN
jgi:hypothetical protein